METLKSSNNRENGLLPPSKFSQACSANHSAESHMVGAHGHVATASCVAAGLVWNRLCRASIPPPGCSTLQILGSSSLAFLSKHLAFHAYI